MAGKPDDHSGVSTEVEIIAEHTFVCKRCPGCGDPHYIDGCLDCGHGIDGIARSDDKYLA